jgi:hypothetical protein
MLKRLETLRSRLVLRLNFGLAGVIARWPREAEMYFEVLRFETTIPDDDADDAVDDDVDDDVVALRSMQLCRRPGC